ncbi:MAG: hypothetical protein WBG91_04825 [Syntrophobacteria bacterium]
MAVLPGVLGYRPLRRTVQVRLGTNILRLPGGTSIFTVSRQQFMKYPGYLSGATLLLSYERDQRKKGNAISAAAFSLATLRSFLFFRFRQLVFTPLIRISHENAAATIEAPCSQLQSR